MSARTPLTPTAADPTLHTITAFQPTPARVPAGEVAVKITRPRLLWAWAGASVVIDVLGALAAAPHGMFALLAGLTLCAVITVGTLVALVRWQERHVLPDFPVRAFPLDADHRTGGVSR